MSELSARTYGIELLTEAAPTIVKAQLLENLRRWCPSAQPMDRDGKSSLLAFVHPDHPIELADARIAAQTLVAVAEKPLSHDTLSDALGQSWEFSEAKELVSGCASSVLMTDLMSSALEYHSRLNLFQRVLRGLLETVPCAAIHWQRSQRIVDPIAWKKTFDEGDAAALFFAGAVNVRLFKVEGRAPGETVMDTMGLSAHGLPDLQCHFKGLDPSDVAGALYNTAWYIFQKGDVIADGNTVEGPTKGSKWRCQHETSLVGPERVVLDLDAGKPYAAGDRA